MAENIEQKLILIENLLNDFLSFNKTVKFKVIDGSNQSSLIVVVIVDSLLFQMVSPNYDKSYRKFFDGLDNKVLQLIKKYFSDEVEIEEIIYLHKNFNKIVSIIKPILDRFKKKYKNIEYDILSTKNGPELTISIYRKPNPVGKNIMSLFITYDEEYKQTLFEDFYVVSGKGYTEIGSQVNKIYKSTEHN